MSVEISSDFLLPNLFGGVDWPSVGKTLGKIFGIIVLVAVGIIIYHFSVVTSIEKNLTTTIIYSQMQPQPPQPPTQPPTQMPTGMSTRMPNTTPPTTR
jgi:hypothetical protein